MMMNCPMMAGQTQQGGMNCPGPSRRLECPLFGMMPALAGQTSAFGTKRTSRSPSGMSAFGVKADITSPRGSGPQAGCLNYRHEGAPQFPSHQGGNAHLKPVADRQFQLSRKFNLRCKFSLRLCLKRLYRLLTAAALKDDDKTHWINCRRVVACDCGTELWNGPNPPK